MSFVLVNSESWVKLLFQASVFFSINRDDDDVVSLGIIFLPEINKHPAIILAHSGYSPSFLSHNLFNLFLELTVLLQ